jgi:hypothetical protein
MQHQVLYGREKLSNLCAGSGGACAALKVNCVLPVTLHTRPRLHSQDIQPGAELLASYGSFRRKCNYAVDVAECTAQRPLQLGCRTDLGTGTAQNQQSKAQADLWRRNSFQGSEIDFSQPNRRAEVMVEARFLEMFGGPHCTAGTSNEMSAGDSMSARAARADPEPRRRLRRCDQQGGDGSAKLDLALSDVLTSSASSAPPTGAGSVDMLVNGEVIVPRSCTW